MHQYRQNLILSASESLIGLSLIIVLGSKPRGNAELGQEVFR